MRTKLTARGGRLRFEQLEDRRLLAMTTLGAVADTHIQFGVNENSNYGASEAMSIRQNDDAPRDFLSYVRFDLSTVDIETLTDAKLTLTATGGHFWVGGRFRVVGLDNVAGNTPQNWGENSLTWNSAGAEIDTSIYPNPSAPDSVLSLARVTDLDGSVPGVSEQFPSNGNAGSKGGVTGQALVAFLQSRIDDGGLATFIIDMPVDNNDATINFATREHANLDWRPVLELTYGESEPEPEPYPENPVVLPRQMEKLDRGLIAFRRSASEVYLGWRLLGNDPADIAFNLYRSVNGGTPVKLNALPITQTTDFVDGSANFFTSNSYFIRPVIGGVEQPNSKTYTLDSPNTSIQQYLEVPIQQPAPVTTSDGVVHTYSANDASVGDLDGDGDYEIVLKWVGEPADLFAPSANMYVDAYDLDGTMLWRIDVGPNLKTIASSLQFIVYDLDGDGRAEVAMNTSDGAVSGTGQVIGNPNASWQTPDGWVTTGPEYLTIFDGLTGAIRVNTPLAPERGAVTDWGDDYGHRSTTHNYSVAYLDGQRPSLVLGRGIYHGQAAFGTGKTEIVAWDYRDGQLTKRWTFTATEGTGADINPEYVGQGNHQSSVADVDGDGFDEIIWGAMVVDHDGTGLYSTGRGHGDALHVADMDPDNPGLEIFSPHESPGEYGVAGGDYRDAMTGELLFGIPANNDVGRGVAFDIDPNHPGFEFWATTSDPQGGATMIYNVQNGPLYEMPSNMFTNFGIWWDADLTRELLDRTTISDWNNPGRSNFDLDPGTAGTQQFAPGVSSNNGTKSTPALQADLFGDWREEVVWRRSDNSALRIFSTVISATNRIPTLMHDLQYREAIAWQNVYYNQPPHPSYFLGTGMSEPPRPPLFFGGELAGDYNLDRVVDAADYSLWRDSLGGTENLSADGNHNGMVDQGDYAVWRENFGAVAPATIGAVAAGSIAATIAAPDPAASTEPTIDNPAPFAPEFFLGSASTMEADGTAPAATAAVATDAAPPIASRALLLLLSTQGINASEITQIDETYTSAPAEVLRPEQLVELAFERWDDAEPIGWL